MNTRASARSRVAKIKTKKRRRPIPEMTIRQNKSGMMVGRPRRLNRTKLGAEVCERLSNGELLPQICAELGISENAPWRWASDDEAFSKLYAEARRLQSHAIATRAVMVGAGVDPQSRKWKKAIKDAKNELRRSDPKNWRQRVRELEKNLTARNRLMVDTLKWYARVTNPRDYSEKHDITTGGEQLPAGPSIVAPQALQVTFVGATNGSKAS